MIKNNSLSPYFYSSGSFFLGLSCAVGCIESLIFFQSGADTRSLATFPAWFLLMSTISVISHVYLLRYFYGRGFRLTFYTGLVFLLTNLALLCIQYGLLRVHRELMAYYYPALFIFLGATMLYSVSLVFSKARERSWLRMAGGWNFLLAGMVLATLLWSFSHQDIESRRKVVEISQWLALGSVLVPALFGVNFWKEKRNAQPLVAPRQVAAEIFPGLLAVLLLAATLFLSVSLFTQSYAATHIPTRLKQLAQTFEAVHFVSRTGDSLHYRFLKPLHYSPEKKYPIVISLHGGAGWGTDNMRQLDGIDRWLASDSIRRRYPAFLFVPQLPRWASWGGAPDLVAKDSLVFEALAALEKQYPVDTTRRYVMGHSLGGYGTWYFAGTRPHAFAAALPFAGAGDPALASNLAEVPLWAFHGRNDRNVPVNGSREVIEAIRKAGGHPRYTEYPQGGHGIWNEIETTPGLMEWIFAQRRK